MFQRPKALAPSLLDLIGSTPLVEPSPLAEAVRPPLREALRPNPTGSVKDRVAKAMIDAAEASGELEPGAASAGTHQRKHRDLARAPGEAARGYPLTCVMPANVTEERRRLLRLYGAEIVDSPAEEGSNGAVRLALELAEREPAFFMPFQYGNVANPRAHYDGTGAEIAIALDRVDVLVAGLGTGGTLMGAGERLRESFPDLVVVAAEPLPGDEVMGLRSLAGRLCASYPRRRQARPKAPRDERGVRRRAPASSSSAREYSRGVSSGAVLHAALRVARELDEGVVVCVLADAGWKYLSAGFWDADDVGAAMERSVWW